jgi:hypothetical protein
MSNDTYEFLVEHSQALIIGATALFFAIGAVGLVVIVVELVKISRRRRREASHASERKVEK